MLTARRYLGALIAVAAGVTVVALGALLFAAARPHVPDRLLAAAVVVQAPATTDPGDPFPAARPWSSPRAADLTTRLAVLPGVRAAVADRSFYAQPLIEGRPLERITEGHGWSSAVLAAGGLTAGAAPRAGEVVLDASLGLPPGSPVTVLTAAGPQARTVSGTVGLPVLYLSDTEAAALAPGVRAIGLLLAPGADPGAVADAARNLVGAGERVHVGAARAELEPRADARTRWIGMQILTGTAALAVFATVFVVATTFAFAVAQRRRELALLRTLGATPRQVGRMLRREALLVGLLGSVIGTALGTALATPAGRLLIAAGAEPATFTVRLYLWPIAAALVLGPLVALLGVTVAARRASRVRPLEALRDAAVDQRPMGRLRWIAGGALTLLGVLLAVGTATTGDVQDGATFALYSAMALITGITVLAPAVVPLVVSVLTRPARASRGALALLIRQGALAAPRRTAATAAPVLLTVAFAVLISGMVQTSTEAYAVGRTAAVDAGTVLAPDRTPGLTDAAVRGVSGVALLPTTVFAGDRPLAAAGVDPEPFAAVNRRLSTVSGSIGDLRGDDTVAMTQSAAVRHGSPGAPLEVVFADGERARLRIVAVLADAAVPGDLLLPRATVRRHDPSALTSAVYLDGASPVPPRLSSAQAGARLISMANHAAEADAAEDQLVWIFTLLLIGVSAGYGAIAVATTLLMAAGDRAPDLRLLRRAGATRRQVRQVLAGEAALAVMIGSVLGASVAAAALVSIRAGLSEQVGAPVPLVVPWPVAGGVVALCLILALAASQSLKGAKNLSSS